MRSQILRRWSGISKISFATLCLAGFGWQAWSAVAQDEAEGSKRGPIEMKMRQKLDAAAKVLEGLAIEDKELIHEGSAVLTELSKAEVWRVLKDAEYREHTQSFRTAIRRLDEAAQESKFAVAELEWLSANKSCFDCHNHMRTLRAKAAE